MFNVLQKNFQRVLKSHSDMKLMTDPNKRGMLDWEARIRIIEGIAQGLLYLHQYSRSKGQ